MTENKGKDETRSDNVVYDYSRYLHPALRCECHVCTQARLRLEVGGLAYAVITRQPSPISASQPSQTPAEANIRDGEK